MKKIILSVLLLALPAISIAEEVFKVGVIAPLSGPLAEYGLASQNGIKLAIEQNPELFSNIEFVYEDSQWDPKAAVAALNSLRVSKKVNLFYNWGNPTTEAVAPIAEQQHLPLIALSVDPLVAKNKNFVIRTTNPAVDFANVSAQYLMSKGYKNIGIVIAENTYVQGLYNGLEKALEGNAKIEIVDRYNIQDQDFRSSITKIRAKKYDCIGVFLITGQVSAFYRQLSAQSLSIPTIGTDFFESSTEIKLAEGGMNGSVYPHLGVTDNFRHDYTSKYGNDYQLAYAGNAYDMAMIIGTKFNKLTSSLTADEIMSSLRSVNNFEGIGGTFSFLNTEDGGPHYHYPPTLKKIVGEAIEVVEHN